MIGETIGAWVVERRLGEGGMGTVYVARHQVMGRRVAIKVLRPEHGAKPEMVQRFVNEARAAAAIEHPGIVDVIDVGEREDGGAYLVMELLEGESLATRLKARGKLSADTAVRLTRQIAAALGAAHARGIVHRDLKPDNVFVVPDPETTAGERVKLLDFGIAKLHGELAADAPTTRTGAIFGTPLYMSPEQCRGGVAIDHRADLYALGCMLYEMVCGRTPFRAAGLGDLLSKHMMEPPTPPREHAPALPASVEDLILRLLAKDPAERFASTADVIAALDGRALDEADAPAADLATMPPPTGETMVSLAVSETIAAPTEPNAATRTTTLGGAAAEVAPRRPTPWPVYVGAVAGLGVITAIVLFVLSLRTAKRLAEADWTSRDASTRSSLDAAPQVTPTLGLRFLDALETASGSGLDPYATAGAWEAAGNDFARAIGDGEAPARWRAAVITCAAYAALLRNEPNAEASFRSATQEDPTWAVPYLGLTTALAAAGDRAGAIGTAHEAQRLAPSWWLPIAAEARVHRHLNELDDATAQYRRALRLAPDEPVLLAELALVYHAKHLDTESVRFANRALELDPEMNSARLLLAERALERGDYKVALEEADRVVAADPRSASGQLARADALSRLGDLEQARLAYDRVLALEAETNQQSVSKDRLAAIQDALDKGELPEARGKRSLKKRSKTTGKKPADDRSHKNDDMLPDL